MSRHGLLHVLAVSVPTFVLLSHSILAVQGEHLPFSPHTEEPPFQTLPLHKVTPHQLLRIWGIKTD